MNKTVNINLAGIFFHIDEDAYMKLQRYLEAIKHSFTDSEGRSEIISDIEARIAELFNERLKNEKQVVRIKELDEVIAIMGQPEDYLIDDDIFEDEPNQKPKNSVSKKLYRDTENSYISGVSSGLGHYFGIDAIWIRLAWILLIFGAGTGILLYILLWILVPEAKTTAEKIMMIGEPVNISNIEKQIKDGFENVSSTVSGVAKSVSDSVSNAAKNVDLKKQSNKIKSTSKTFFDTLADIVMLLLKVLAKFIGILLIFIGAAMLIALIIGVFSLGAVNIINIPDINVIEMANTGGLPIWLLSLFLFFAVGIPFFFLFYLGLKILITNLKSIGKIAKFSLLGLWIISIIGLSIAGIRQANEHAFNESYTKKVELPITKTDTLHVKMSSKNNRGFNFNRYDNSFKIITNKDGTKMLYTSNIRIMVKSTTDTLASIAIEKSADGNNYDKAMARAIDINYDYELNNNTLLLNPFFTTNAKNKFSGQKTNIILYIPINNVVYFNNSTSSFLNTSSRNNNIVLKSYTNHYLKILDDDIICSDCPEEGNKLNKTENQNLKINNDGLEINANDSSIKINNNGIEIKSDDVEININ